MRTISRTVDRRIEVGKKYNIAPTLAFLGVLPGTIEVLEIGYKEDIEDRDAQISIQCYIDAYHDEDICAAIQEELEGIWVSYMYTDGQSDAIDVFPLDEFLRHTSEWI